ncbi:MAG: RsmE family RNA methyltransferase [Planctomycetaceae bacterium]
MPATVTIPAGQSSITFFIDAVNDPGLDGPQNVAITATSAGYVSGTVGVTVLDHEPPVLTGPTATTPSSKPTITWNALPGALRYDVWVTNLTAGIAQIVRDIDVPTNSFVPPENLGIGRYRVWVRAIGNLEVAGFWSKGRDFFINTPATITSPAPTTIIAGSSFPTITWSAIPDAVKYEVWVNNLTTGQFLVINRTGTAALSTTSYVSTENLPSGTYRIWVRGLNSSGEAGLWSAPTTHTVLAPPVITQPLGGGTFDTTPTLSWTAITGATSYDVYVADAKTKVVVLRNKFVTTTAYTATKDIAVGEYQWWVRAQSGNSYSAWSAPSTFSIGLPPKITSVRTVGTPAKPQFSWTTIAGTERYELSVNNKATTLRVIYETNLTTTTYTSPTILPAGTYRVWVRAVSTMGETTAWSTAVDLVIAASELRQDSVDSAQTTILASWILDDGPLSPDGSRTEHPEAFAWEADAPVNAEQLPDTGSPAASPVKSIIPVRPHQRWSQNTMLSCRNGSQPSGGPEPRKRMTVKKFIPPPPSQRALVLLFAMVSVRTFAGNESGRRCRFADSHSSSPMLTRAFCELLLTDDVVVDDTEAHHLLHVLRFKPGDQVQLFDGCGMEADAVVTRISRREVFCTVTTRRQTSQIDRVRVTVIAAPPKADRLKWMVEKLTEIGVERLILLQTDRTEVTPRESRREKLRSSVIAACKQSRRNEIMQLSPLQSLTSVLDDVAHARLSGELWIAHPSPSNPTQASDAVMPIQSRLLLIGPEGGFTEAELQAALNADARVISWPHTILRIETAAVVFATRLLSD